jgi:hypothetical protein
MYSLTLEERFGPMKKLIQETKEGGSMEHNGVAQDISKTILWFRRLLKTTSVMIIYFVCTPCLSQSASESFQLAKQACELKPDAQSCFVAGNILWNIGKSNIMQCPAKEDVACQRDGESLVTSLERIGKEAFRLNKMACEHNHGEACTNVGTYYAIEGTKRPLDQWKFYAPIAEACFKKSCQLGFSNGCRFIGSTSYKEPSDTPSASCSPSKEPWQ